MLARRVSCAGWDEIGAFLVEMGYPDATPEARDLVESRLQTRPEFFAPEIEDDASLTWLRRLSVADPWFDYEGYGNALAVLVAPYRLAVESLLLAGLPHSVIATYVSEAFADPDVDERAVGLFSHYLFDRAALSPTGWRNFLEQYESEIVGDLMMFFTSGPEYAHGKMGIKAEIDTVALVRGAIRDTRAMMSFAQGRGDVYNGVAAARALFEGVRLYGELKETDLSAALRGLRMKKTAPPRIIEGTLVDGVVIPAEPLPALAPVSGD